jgi:hypothetical protein
MNYRGLLVLGVCMLSVCVLPVVTQAAVLYLDPGVHTLQRGDAVSLSLRLNVDESAGECVNAIDAVIRYPSTIQPVDVSVGKSIFNLWVEAPVIDREQRTITFAGGLPNGYCGRVAGDPSITNVIADLVFRSPGMVVGRPEGDESLNEAFIEFDPVTRVLLNDGQGTPANLQTIGARIVLDRSPSPAQTDAWRDAIRDDTTPPEEFSITLVQDDQIHNQKYYIVFNTTDKQTGIAEYQVMEEPLESFGAFEWGRADAPWIAPNGVNYHVLSDQSLNSIIRVRAIDKAGNEYIATLIPDEALRSMSTQTKLFYGFIAALGVLVSVVTLTVVWYIRRRARRRSVTSDTTTESTTADHDNPVLE